MSFLAGPASVGFVDQAVWDVDGQNGADFALLGLNYFGVGSTTASGKFVDTRTGFNLFVNGSFTASGASAPLNGVGFVTTSAPLPLLNQALRPLSSGAQVGGTLATYSPNSNLGVGAFGQVLRLFSSVSGALTNQSSSPSSYGFGPGAPGTFNIGFSFLSAGDTHFGWASVTITAGPD